MGSISPHHHLSFNAESRQLVVLVTRRRVSSAQASANDLRELSVERAWQLIGLGQKSVEIGERWLSVACAWKRPVRAAAYEPEESSCVDVIAT